jgi:hypothetical protein
LGHGGFDLLASPTIRRGFGWSSERGNSRWTERENWRAKPARLGSSFVTATASSPAPSTTSYSRRPARFSIPSSSASRPP